jgi:hypothetical protein
MGVKMSLPLVTAIAPEQLSNGSLSHAEIVMRDEHPVTLDFDETGASVAAQDVASGERTVTVAKLIEALASMPKDAIVLMDSGAELSRVDALAGGRAAAGRAG